MSWRRWPFWMVWLNLAFVSPAAAQPEVRHVLLLSSFQRDPIAVFTQTFRTELSRQSPEPINFFDVSIRPTPFDVMPREELVVDYVRATISAVRRLDLVVSMAGTSAVFVQKHGERLFPTTPLIRAAGDARFMKDPSATLNETTVAVELDLPRMIENILLLLPETTRVFVVIGTSESEEFWRKEMVREFERFKDRLTFVWFNELSFTDILERSSALPPHSAIFYPTLVVDGKGVFHSEERALAQLHSVANAPIFGIYDFELGHGIVGGPLTSMADLAQRAADVALRILRGETPGNIKTAPQRPRQPTYDWRELRRWGISEARLPAGSIVQFRQQSVWAQYRSYILGVAIILGLQSALIARLVVQRVRRRRSESALRDSEAALRKSYEQTQDLAGRLITAQEAERARIGRDLHDDVCQRLAVMAITLSGLKHRLSGSTPQPDVEEVLTALQERTSTLATDVRNLSHDLHPSVLEHAGLVPVLKAHCDEFARQQKIDVTFSADEGVGSTGGAAALCLYRVAQEALTNTGKHASASAVRVRLSRTAEAIELEVVDNGIGFVASEHSGGGLGLRGIDERVRFNKGIARVESHPGQGTSVFVRVPL